MVTESRVNYSSKTIEAYIYWIKEFIFFNNKKHPELLGENEIRRLKQILNGMLGGMMFLANMPIGLGFGRVN